MALLPSCRPNTEGGLFCPYLFWIPRLCSSEHLRFFAKPRSYYIASSCLAPHRVTLLPPLWGALSWIHCCSCYSPPPSPLHHLPAQFAHSLSFIFPSLTLLYCFFFPTFTHPHFDLFLVLLTVTPCLFSPALPRMTPKQGRKGEWRTAGETLAMVLQFRSGRG